VARKLNLSSVLISQALVSLEGDCDVEQAKRELMSAQNMIKATALEVQGRQMILPNEGHEGTRQWLVRTFSEDAEHDSVAKVNRTISQQMSFGRRNTRDLRRGDTIDMRIDDSLSSRSVCGFLDRAGEIDFDAINFASQPEVGGKPITVLFAHLLSQCFDPAEVMELNSDIKQSKKFEKSILAFCGKLDTLYRNVPYHSRAHACDVMSMMQWLMETSFIDSVTTCLDHFMTLMAGAIHDVGHLGRTNAFLSSTMAPVAIRYNDRSVLENMHVSLAFETMRENEETNWFGMLRTGQGCEQEGDIQKFVRTGLITMVLATDMANHKSQHQAMESLVESLREPVENNQEKMSLEDKLFFLGSVLHAGDISSPCKPRPIMLAWTQKLLTEFWSQGDEERSLGLPISPLCDRESLMMSVPTCQLGFTKFVVQPFWESLQIIIPEASEPIDTLKANVEFWEVHDREKRSYDQIFSSLNNHVGHRRKDHVVTVRCS